jgi:multicomponent Na+:H+ antiporter subunit B
LINMALLTLLAAVTIGVVRMRNLFGVVVLAGIYSFLMASLLVVLDAVDVAMTEAAVGAGLSTVVLLATLHLTKTMEYPRPRKAYLPLFVATVIGAALVWGTYSLPPFGTADAVIHKHVVPRYLSDTLKDTMVPNVVTSVLADYRGYDTLGETTVIFTAGIGVLLLLKGRRRHGTSGADEGGGA